jgi:hypothetical protein
MSSRLQRLPSEVFMEQPTAPSIISPFAFDGKELQRLEIDGDIWYFADEVRDLLGITNLRQILAKVKPEWRSVYKVYENRPGRPKTLINTKAVIKIALRSRWDKADDFAEEIADIAERYYKGDISLAEEVIERNGGRDQAGLERVAVQAGMFMQHEAMQRTMRRFEGIEARKAFTSMLGRHSVTPIGYGHCTNRIYQGTLGGKAKDVSKRLGLTKKQNLRDHLPTVDLIGVTLAEALATERIEKEDAQGDRQCGTVCEIASHEVGQAIRRTRA